MSDDVIKQLREKLLATGKLSQQQIEDAIKEYNITGIEPSVGGKEMKNHINKINDIFNRTRLK